MDEPGSGGGRSTSKEPFLEPSFTDRAKSSAQMLAQSIPLGGRYTRRFTDLPFVLGLRQAPPPRQLWQPDTSSTRQPRQAGHASSPQPAMVNATSYAMNPAADPKSAHFNIASYEPKPQMPLTLRPVLTPGSNPDLFRQKKLLAKTQLAAKQVLGPQSFLKGLLPGSKSPGPIHRLQVIPNWKDLRSEHLHSLSVRSAVWCRCRRTVRAASSCQSLPRARRQIQIRRLSHPRRSSPREGAADLKTLLWRRLEDLVLGR